MKAYDNEYYELFDKFISIKNMLEDKVNLQSEEFATLYDWTDRYFTLTNADCEDIENMIEDMEFYKCKTFADFALFYMSNYVDKLRNYVELQE